MNCDWYEPDQGVSAQKGLFFYRNKKATIYNRIALLWLAEQLFGSGPRQNKLREDVEIREAGDLGERLRCGLEGYLEPKSFCGLYRSLHCEAVANGLMASKSVRSRPTKATQVALGSIVDWAWVAGEVKEEWGRHGHRRTHRHAELCYGRTLEEIELGADLYAAKLAEESAKKAQAAMVKSTKPFRHATSILSPLGLVEQPVDLHDRDLENSLRAWCGLIEGRQADNPVKKTRRTNSRKRRDPRV